MNTPNVFADMYREVVDARSRAERELFELRVAVAGLSGRLSYLIENAPTNTGRMAELIGELGALVDTREVTS